MNMITVESVRKTKPSREGWPDWSKKNRAVLETITFEDVPIRLLYREHNPKIPAVDGVRAAKEMEYRVSCTR